MVMRTSCHISSPERRGHGRGQRPGHDLPLPIMGRDLPQFPLVAVAGLVPAVDRRALRPNLNTNTDPSQPKTDG